MKDCCQDWLMRKKHAIGATKDVTHIAPHTKMILEMAFCAKCGSVLSEPPKPKPGLPEEIYLSDALTPESRVIADRFNQLRAYLKSREENNG